jgi:hypothetical protein
LPSANPRSEIPTFSCNNVIEAITVGKLLFNKSMDDVFIAMGENESLECILTPDYRTDILDIKLS